MIFFSRTIKLIDINVRHSFFFLGGAGHFNAELITAMMIFPESSSGLHSDTILLGCSSGMYRAVPKTSRMMRAARRCCGIEQ